MGRAFAAANGLGRVFLALIVAAVAAAPAHADLRGAYSEYKKGEYARAFQEFLSMAELGQPQAQFVVAQMYHDGQGTGQSDIHAYAWATLAAADGEALGKALAEKIRPTLAPGSEQISGWVTRPYMHAALEQSLLPDTSSSSAQHLGPSELAGCKRESVRISTADYPTDARIYAVGGRVLSEFMLMPDGHARFPHIVYAEPAGVFEDGVRSALLRSRFSVAPRGSPPARCLLLFNFTLTSPNPHAQTGIPTYWVAEAQAGDPPAQLLYGLMLGEHGIPWLVKAAQAGVPAAQYELARDLLLGYGCREDEAKALRWLKMAADQDQPDADLLLATRLLRGTPTDSDVVRAKAWLERAVAAGARDGSQKDKPQAIPAKLNLHWPLTALEHAEDHGVGDGARAAQLLLAAIVAATPQPALRDPGRALELLRQLGDDHEDPTRLEIQAAAQGAEGDYAAAMHSERSAMSRARRLGWDLAPLEQRLASYEAGKPWYGSIIRF